MPGVAELAEACGVSEQAVRRYSSRNGFRKSGGRWSPTEEQVRQLLAHHGVEVDSQPKTKQTKQTKPQTQPKTQPSQPQPEGLSDEREPWYREQIDALNRRCDELTRLLDQEQRLHASVRQELAALKSPSAEAVARPRRAWWRFWER